MIQHSTQLWEVGEAVKVGFLRLIVLAKVPTPGDYRPDAYALLKGSDITREVQP